jgi:hypothetical protein
MTKNALQIWRRPPQAFRPANGRRAALKGCATFDSATPFYLMTND